MCGRKRHNGKKFTNGIKFTKAEKGPFIKPVFGKRKFLYETSSFMGSSQNTTPSSPRAADNTTNILAKSFLLFGSHHRL